MANSHNLVLNTLRDHLVELVVGVFYLHSLRERLRTHKVFTKDQTFYLSYHKFSIKSYILDVY